MNRNISTLIVAAFALALTLSSPAFAQFYTIGGNCPGGVCRSGNCQQTAATVAASPCAPCASACGYSYQQAATFAPFGGFFRNLFGGCGDSCAAVRPCARFVERGAQGSACSGGKRFADPVNREFVPGEQTNAVEPCEPVAKTETDAETCEPCDPVEKSNAGSSPRSIGRANGSAVAPSLATRIYSAGRAIIPRFRRASAG